MWDTVYNVFQIIVMRWQRIKEIHWFHFFHRSQLEEQQRKMKQKTSELVCANGAQKYPVYFSLSPLAIVRNTTAPWSYPRPPTLKPRSLPLHHNRTVNTLLSQFRALKQPRCVQTQGLFCSVSWMSVVLDLFFCDNLHLCKTLSVHVCLSQVKGYREVRGNEWKCKVASLLTASHSAS